MDARAQACSPGPWVVGSCSSETDACHDGCGGVFRNAGRRICGARATRAGVVDILAPLGCCLGISSPRGELHYAVDSEIGINEEGISGCRRTWPSPPLCRLIKNHANITMSEQGPTPVPGATEPFWRTELHELDSHRSTPHLPEECDVLIVGAGFSGAALAHYLYEDNPSPPSTVILEAREACSGATGRNGMWLSPVTYLVQGDAKTK